MKELPKPPTSANPHRGKTALLIVFCGLLLYGVCLANLPGEFAGQWAGKQFGIALDLDSGGFVVGLGLQHPIPWREDQGASLVGFVLNYRFKQIDPSAFYLHEWFFFGLPWWYIFALFLAPSLDRVGIRWAYLARLRAGEVPNHCRKCGYDLRASPRRCPECGKIRGEHLPP